MLFFYRTPWRKHPLLAWTKPVLLLLFTMPATATFPCFYPKFFFLPHHGVSAYWQDRENICHSCFSLHWYRESNCHQNRENSHHCFILHPLYLLFHALGQGKWTLPSLQLWDATEATCLQARSPPQAVGCWPLY